MNKIAIDWDESELRIVTGQVRGNKLRITDAAIIPLGPESEQQDIHSLLKQAVDQRKLNTAEALVAIGRGKAELRELQLPPVDDTDLPDMVRFQAIRSFASSGESSIVDYLITNRNDSNVDLIAAAVSPNKLNEIRNTCTTASLEAKRIALRPLSAAALFLSTAGSKAKQTTVLVDLLASDAEIVVARDGRVIFVRTVKVPTSGPSRSKSLAGELRRSLVACGIESKPERVVLWGKESVHARDQQMLSEACDAPVEVIDPFSLVDLEASIGPDLPEHVGRLAPLVGLLHADTASTDRLIDFLNPRKRPEEKPNYVRNYLLAGVPAALVLLIGYLVWSKFSSLDERIATLKSENAAMQPGVDAALSSISRTDEVDRFLDSGVQWLDEIRRLANQMPGSEKMIVKTISASADQRNGGGSLVVAGASVAPGAIVEFENSLRDPEHMVIGDAVKKEKTDDAYRWGFKESIQVSPDYVKNLRYEKILALLQEASEPEKDPQSLDTDESVADSSTDNPEIAQSNEPPANEASSNEPSSNDPSSVGAQQ